MLEMKQMIKNKCIVCGKEFYARQSNYTLCSGECKKKRVAELNKKYMSDPVIHERHRLQSIESYRRRAKIIKCKICGEPVPPSDSGGRMSRKHYHEECVVREALQAISEGGKSTKGTGDKRIFRAHNVLGMGVGELKELLAEGENEQS